MATGDLTPTAQGGTNAPKRVTNDFSITFATVNGSGSQFANNLLMKGIFGMGVPVSGKNLFPSNIAGMPTWFTIRASKEGYLARKRTSEILVAMNAESAKQDALSLPPGGVAIYEEALDFKQYRDDLVFYPVPFDKITSEVCTEVKLRKQVRNQVYVGVVAQLFGIDLALIDHDLQKQFGKKPKVYEQNLAAVKAGFEYAAQNLGKQDSYFIEKMDKTSGMIIVDGNAASAMGALFAGVTVVAWYPITPSTSINEIVTELLKKYRTTADGKATFAVMQAEDELCAIGAVLGAGWAGARSMTATSGPGISLMAEFSGLGYYAELPGVIFSTQRVGPSTGLPTRTQQGDILSTATLSHGDTKHPILFPGSVQECFDFAVAAFDVTERLQTPVFVLLDLDLGMNQWISNEFQYPEKPMDRGKVLSKEDLDRLGEFARYRDVDGDGIGYRTLPGTLHPKAAYFTRGTGHNDKAGYSEDPAIFKANMDRLNRKFDTARTLVPAPEVVKNKGGKIGFIAYGSTDFAMRESLDEIQQQYGVEADYLRLRAYPFAKEVHEFAAAHERVYIVEQNRDGQMASLLKIDLPVNDVPRLRSIVHYNGYPIDAQMITEEFARQEGK